MTKPLNINKLLPILNKYLRQESPLKDIEEKNQTKDFLTQEKPEGNKVMETNILDLKTINNYKPALVKKLVGMFLTQAPDSIGKIREALSQGNGENVKEESHRLKGSCLGIGAAQMGEICKKIQAKAEKNDLAELSSQVDELEISLGKTSQSMQSFI